MSTIAAISSPIGAGGIGIVRVSGEEALRIADAIFYFAHPKTQEDCAVSCVDGIRQVWQPLMMNYGTFHATDFCDKGYAVYFPAKRAYTGEDTVEFYLHGGVRIMQGALDTLLQNGAVMAKNGEFTKRAFLNGRLSLADAEGVIDMIQAESAAGVKAAYRLMQGDVSRRINEICDRLEVTISTLEATLDYPDEMEDEVLPSLPSEINETLRAVNALIATAKSGKIAKYGINVALAGKANAGKSSLMNALLKEDRAIVTEVAGTTRDTVEDSFECDGVKINLIDTAGIRESDDIVENKGIERAKKAFDGADVILHVIDTTVDENDGIDFGDAVVFDVYNKCDVVSSLSLLKGVLDELKERTEGDIVSALDKSIGENAKVNKVFFVSAKTGEGVDELACAIASLYKEDKVEGGEIITSQRHVSALYQAKTALEGAILSLDDTIDCTLIDLRRAYNALGEITGKTATEDVVDGIFSRFCVGK